MHMLHLISVFLYFGQGALAREIKLTDEHKEEIIQCCDDDEIFVIAEDGYQILITVEAFDIPYSSGKVHYLLVKSGTNSNDGLDGRIFTHYIKTPREYLSLNSKVYMQFAEINANGETSKRGMISGENTMAEKIKSKDLDEPETPEPIGEFLITVRRFGEGTTTAMPTTTELPWPTPSAGESDNVTVNISGKSPSWYTQQNLRIFTQKVVKMAIEYTTINNINTTEAITLANVFIDNLVQCPINWPNRNKCVQITFRLPIFQPEGEKEYQLNTENLEIMWLRHSENYLGPEFANYETPENSVFITWLIIICVTILLFSVVLYIFKRFSYKLSGVNIRKKSVNNEQDEILPVKPLRNDSLNPHPKQIVPGMFESENQYYDPDSTDNNRK